MPYSLQPITAIRFSLRWFLGTGNPAHSVMGSNVCKPSFFNLSPGRVPGLASADIDLQLTGVEGEWGGVRGWGCWSHSCLFSSLELTSALWFLILNDPHVGSSAFGVEKTLRLSTCPHQLPLVRKSLLGSYPNTKSSSETQQALFKAEAEPS